MLWYCAQSHKELSPTSHQHCDAALQEFLQEVQASADVEYGQLAGILVRQAQSADEVTRITALRWLRAFVVQGKQQLLPYYAAILAAVLPNVSHSSQDICQVQSLPELDSWAIVEIPRDPTVLQQSLLSSVMFVKTSAQSFCRAAFPHQHACTSGTPACNPGACLCLLVSCKLLLIGTAPRLHLLHTTTHSLAMDDIDVCLVLEATAHNSGRPSEALMVT